MNIRDRKIRSGSMRITLAMLATLPTWAQEVAHEPQLEEITVTAQKREQSINDVGMSIQAATGDALETRGISGPEDLGKIVTGYTFTKSIYSTPVFTLRGIGLYDATFGAVPAVAIYTDQVPRNFPVMSSALDLDLERVEVLKGPQGTLFGQSSTGGAINYIVAKPTGHFESGFDASWERFDEQTLSGFVSGPLSETVKARLAVRSTEGGAWQYSISRPGDENGAQRKLEGRLTVDWTPVDALSVETSLTAARDRSDPQAPQYAGTVFDIYSSAALAAANANPATANPYGYVNNAAYAGFTTPGSPNYDPSFLGRQSVVVSRLNGPDSVLAAGARAILGSPIVTSSRAADWTPGLLGPSQNYYYQGSVRMDYKLSDALDLTSISALAHQRIRYAQDLDGTPVAVVDVPLTGLINAFNQELRLSGSTEAAHWMVGGAYDASTTHQSNDYELANYSGNEPVPGLFISLTQNDFESSLKSYAAFANLDYQFTHNWSATAGARYTKNEEWASYCYNDPAADSAQNSAQVFGIFQNLFTGQTQTPIQPGQCFVLGDGLAGTTFGKATISPVQRTLDQSNTSFHAALNYKFDQGTLAYASISQGNKAGLFSAIGASSTSQYAPATQEKVVAYEAGFKAPMFDHRLEVNGAAFYYDYKDKQVRARVLDPIFGLLEKMVNIPKSKVWGLEAELEFRPTTGLTMSASGSFLRSDITSYFTKTSDGSTVYNAAGYSGNFQGSDLPFTPKFTGNLGADYQLSTGRSWDPFVGGNLTYQGRESTTFSNAVLRDDGFEIPGYALADMQLGIRAPDGHWQVNAFVHNAFNKMFVTSITTYLDTTIRFTGQPVVYGVGLKMNFH